MAHEIKAYYTLTDMLFRREPIRAQIRRQPADASLFTPTHAEDESMNSECSYWNQIKQKDITKYIILCPTLSLFITVSFMIDKFYVQNFLFIQY
jgi:hypothetical protein